MKSATLDFSATITLLPAAIALQPRAVHARAVAVGRDLIRGGNEVVQPTFGRGLGWNYICFVDKQRFFSFFLLFVSSLVVLHSHVFVFHK